MALDSIDIDLNAMKATAKLKDMRPVLCLVRDLAYSPKASGVLGDGIARFATPGATWTFTRAAEETFTNPVGESETVPANIPGYADGGLQILAGTRYYVSNNSAARTWSAAQGGFACEVKLTGTISQDRTIAYVYHDTNNWAKVYYDHASTKIKFAIRAAGTTTTITSTTTPISGTWYAVEASWSGSQDENGASYTMTLYINGVVEVSGTASGAMTEVSSSNFDFGSAAGSAELLGLIRKIHSWQYVRNSYESGRNL
jgi:Concanavalin A-like lectin/glucanases superfamily